MLPKKNEQPRPSGSISQSPMRKVVLTAVSLSLLTPTFSAFAQYKYKAYVKDLLTNGTTIVVPPPDQTGQLTLTPTSFEFPNTPKNSTSEAVFTAKNTSTNTAANITLGSPALSNTNGFSYIATCPAILAPQASCEIRVRFTPPDPSTYTSSLSFPSANAAAPLPSSSLIGQGINSAITFSANPLNFPDTDIASTSAPQTLTITNAGSIRLSIASLSATAPYAITANTCGDYLYPAQSCTATLTFSPAIVGPNPSLFSFNTDTQTFTTSLTGNGLGPVLTITPSAIMGATTIDLTPNAAATPQSFSPLALGTPSDPNLNYKKLTSTTTITNSGTKPLTNLDLSYSASSTTSPYISSTCPTTLAAGASCTISLSAYRHLKNKHTGFLTLSGNAIPTKQIPVSLDISPSTPDVIANSVASDSTSYDFGPVVVHQPSTAKRITFSYTGNTTANLTLPANPLLSLANNTCENTPLYPGDTCSVDVALTPNASHINATATWMPTYTLTTAPSPVQIPHQFTYTGLGETLSLNPASLSTSTTTTSPSSTTYTLSNTGNRASALSFFHAASDPSFNLSTSTSCSTIQPGTSCTLTAVAASNLEGVHTGTLTIQGSTTTISAPSTLTVSDAPNLTLSSKSVNFGTVVQGATVSTQAVQLANVGASPALLGSLSTTAPFTLSHNCPSSLPALSTCTLSFSLDTSSPFPSSTSTLTSSVTLGAGQLYAKTVSLVASQQGTIVNNLGDLTLSPKSATFPYTPEGQQSYPKIFTITNANSAPSSLPIIPTTIGADASQYTLSNNTCPTSIPANSSCTVNVSYTPTSPSLNVPQATQLGLLYDGVLTLTADLLASDVPVNALTFNPLNFNPSNPTTGNNVQYYYYKNTSANPITFSPQLQIGSHFSVLANTCASLQPSSACKITVHAKTDTEGNFSDTLSANGTLITLNSTVFPFPSLNFSQYGNTITALDYGTVSHKKPLPASTTQLNNTSTSPAVLSPIIFFSLSGVAQSNDCSGTSATTGTLCNFNINVSPSTLASPLNADSYNWSSTLTVSTADGLAHTSLPIKGTAVVGSNSLPASIDFGTLYLGETATKPLSITNTSTNQAEISVTALSTGTSDITHSTPCLNTWLAPSQSCVSTLSMTPTSPGIRTGSISLGIVSKSNQPRTVPWTASVLSGFNTETVLSPNSWAPTTTVGTPITQLITLTNTYYQPLTISAPSFSSSFPAPLTISANTCSGQTIQPQATCTLTLQLSSSNPHETATASTISFSLSPVNQSVSLTIPSAYVSIGDPTITSLTASTYPAGFTIPNSTVAINGTGFTTLIANTKVFVNGTQLTTSALTTGPLLGWRIASYASTSRINIFVPATAPTGDYTITVHNAGSPNDATKNLTITTGPAKLTYAISALTPSQNNTSPETSGLIATGTTPLTSTPMVVEEFLPAVNQTTQYTITFSNTGSMPYYITAPLVPAILPISEIASNSCQDLTVLLPQQTCSLQINSTPITTSPRQNIAVFTNQNNVASTLYFRQSPANYSLTSTITAPALYGSPAPLTTSTSISFPDSPTTVSRTATITLLNSSTYSGQNLTPTIALTGPPSYSITSNTCQDSSNAPISLDKAATCVITLSYTPTAPNISEDGLLNITTQYGTTYPITLSSSTLPAYSSAGIDLTSLAFYAPLATENVVAFPSANNGTQVDSAFSVNGPVALLQMTYGGGNRYTFSSNAFNPSVPYRTAYTGTYSDGNTYQSNLYSNAPAPLTDPSAWTFGTWIRSNSVVPYYTNNRGTLYAQRNNPAITTGGAFHIFIGGTNNSLRSICYRESPGVPLGGTGSSLSCSSPILPMDTNWHFLTITKQNAALSISLNGQPPTLFATLANPLPTYSPLQYPSIAGYETAYSATTGLPSSSGTQSPSMETLGQLRITDLFLFSRVLSNSEIAQIATRKAPLQPR